MKIYTKLHRLLITICVCLLLTALSACEKSDSNPDEDLFSPETSEGVMDPDFNAIEFDGDSVVLTAEDAYRYDEPIERREAEGEDHLVFGNWQRKESPAAYWGVDIPEEGEYNVEISYIRTNEEETRGSISFEEWDQEEGEWINVNTSAMTFEGSDSDWEEIKINGREFGNLPAGTYRFSIAPHNPEEESGLLIMFISAQIIKADSELYNEDTDSEDSELFNENTDSADSELYDENTDSEEDMLWAGSFISEDEEMVLAMVNIGEGSFQFAFISEDSEDEGIAQISDISPDSAESDGYFFWFMDDDSLLVSGGAFEGSYNRVALD